LRVGGGGVGGGKGGKKRDRALSWDERNWDQDREGPSRADPWHQVILYPDARGVRSGPLSFTFSSSSTRAGRDAAKKGCADLNGEEMGSHTNPGAREPIVCPGYRLLSA